MELKLKKCTPCRGGDKAFSPSEVQGLLPRVPNWSLSPDGKAIVREFKFKNFAEALVFVNKVGSICEEEGHHADIEFGWGYCRLTFTTHDVGGLHENDFIMAAKL